MAIEEVKVPDIGDFSDVPVIGIMVAAGDSVDKEDPLIELESDKATMEVPSPVAGKITEILISEGDKVSEGTPILKVEVEGAASDEAGSKDDGQEADAPKKADTEKSSDADAKTRQVDAGARSAAPRTSKAEKKGGTFMLNCLSSAPARAAIRPPFAQPISA